MSTDDATVTVCEFALIETGKSEFESGRVDAADRMRLTLLRLKLDKSPDAVTDIAAPAF